MNIHEEKKINLSEMKVGSAKTSVRALPIVMISMSRWDGDFSSAAYSLAKSFAKSNTVVYVDYPYTWLDLLRERKLPSVKKRLKALIFKKEALNNIPGQSPNLYFLTPPAMLPINFLPEGLLFRYCQGINNRILFKSIQRALLKLKAKDFIFFNSFNPLYGQKLPKELSNNLMVYQSRDSIRALEPYLQKHGVQLENEAISNADLRLATSSTLTQILKSATGKEVVHFANAADINNFRTALEADLPKPVELNDIRGPIIGYTGNICQRVDYDLLKRICDENPDKSIVLVGPRNHWSHTNIDLDAIVNLHFCGAQPLELLPHFLKYFDVGIIPFKKNDLTASIYPLKINEYLAAGLPVISTNFSKDIAGFSEHIWLINDNTKFTDSIEDALLHRSQEEKLKRLSIAEKNSWDGRVDWFWELLEATEKCKALHP
jgi:glycosyltransferase involved in cell wall biosynthesis